ncbi:MAG TPA: universal stress protein [Acidimicrobiales bacterium]
MTYRTVVVGTDGSSTAEEAVRHAGELAARAGARLVAVTAYHPHGDGDGEVAPEDLRWMVGDRATAEAEARRARALAAELGVADVVVRAEPGDPADVIVATAEEFDADLVVVGSKGLGTPATRFLLGSVAGAVSHHAPCDVLVVHTAP